MESRCYFLTDVLSSVDIENGSWVRNLIKQERKIVFLFRVNPIHVVHRLTISIHLFLLVYTQGIRRGYFPEVVCHLDAIHYWVRHFPRMPVQTIPEAHIYLIKVRIVLVLIALAIVSVSTGASSPS